MKIEYTYGHLCLNNILLYVYRSRRSQIFFFVGTYFLWIEITKSTFFLLLIKRNLWPLFLKRMMTQFICNVNGIWHYLSFLVISINGVDTICLGIVEVLIPICCEYSLFLRKPSMIVCVCTHVCIMRTCSIFIRMTTNECTFFYLNDV